VALQIAGRNVGRIAIVDDDKAVRQAYELSVEELELQPVNESGPLGALDVFAIASAGRAEGAVCDFKLRVKNYSTFDGAELVARWYDLGFPALLCTKWDRASVDEMRRFRARIPILIRPSDLDAESIVSGLEVCIRELDGSVMASRRPWRTLVRVEDVSDDRTPYVYIVVPSWNPDEVVRLPLNDIPEAVRPSVRPDARLYARINLGAETYEDLFFQAWETKA
jgi:hypothetical protein